MNPDEADASGDQPHAGGNIERSKWSRDACGQSAGEHRQRCAVVCDGSVYQDLSRVGWQAQTSRFGLP